MHAELDVVSPWVAHYAGFIKPEARVLDLACGGGRHSRFLAHQGHTVIAVDRDPESLAKVKHPLITSYSLDLEGDDGLNNTWGLYYKNVSHGDEYVTSFVSNTEMRQFDTEKQDVSPNRKSLREKATENVQKKAESVTKKALKKSPTSSLKLGDVVLVPLSDVDCTKVDGKTLAGVIVTINKDKSTCTVAVKEGLLHRAYAFHALRVVPIASNNRKAIDLEDANLHWHGLPKITEREAARFVSSVGGQGMVKCNCKGDCITNSCACKKAGRICSSCCHRNSKCCKNNSD